MKVLTKSLLGVLAASALASCACNSRHMAVDEPRAMLREESSDSNAQNSGMRNVYFAFDRADLSPSSKMTLKENAEWLKRNSMVDVKIEGHADERGTNDYNMALAENRALSAAQYLKSLGIEKGRLSTTSYGEENPLDARHNEEAWAKNRRVEFKALGMN